MPYRPGDIPETMSILGAAFFVGLVAQYLRQKTDITMSNANILWLSVAAGFSSAVTIGLLYHYTELSTAFLFAIAGIAGWAGVTILGKFAKALDLFITSNLEKRLHIKMDEDGKEDKEDSDDRSTTGINSQLE